MLENKSQKYGTEINSHDWIKFLAILIMTIDHIGAYLYPEQLWWRAVGRIGFPVWFFLAGYSFKSSLSRAMILLCGIMIAANALTAHGVFPINALLSILICRWFIAWLDKRQLMVTRLPEIFTAVVFLIPFLSYLFEYGALAILFSILGYLCRTEIGSPRSAWVAAAISFLFVLIQMITFKFTFFQTVIMGGGTIAVVYYLYRFERKPIFIHWPDMAKTGIRFLSRNSLYYYFVHRVILQIIAVIWYMPAEQYHLHWV